MDTEEEFLEELERNNLEPGDIAELGGEIPEKPGFPYIVFTLAIAKDIVDYLDLGTIIGVITNIIVMPILYFWARKRGSNLTRGKEKSQKALQTFESVLKKQCMKRYIVSGISEFVSWLNLVPWYTLMVISIHKKECEQIDKIVSLYENFKKFDKLKKISSKVVSDAGNIIRKAA